PQAEAALVPGRDRDWHRTWDEALVWAKNVLEPVPVAATDPLAIVCAPTLDKRAVRDNGGHMAAMLWSMTHLYGVEPGQVWWAVADGGWAAGWGYAVIAPLLAGCTVVLYE